jgi:hypothetical protein
VTGVPWDLLTYSQGHPPLSLISEGPPNGRHFAFGELLGKTPRSWC